MEEVKILIVEDELIVAEDISDNLSSLGYHVTGIAESYSEAVGLLQSEPPDIAIVDIMLKGPETGIDLGHYIRNTMDMPFIYLTSHSNKLIVKEASKSNPDAFLVKPFKKEELFASIEIALTNYSHKNRTNTEQVEGEEIVIKNSIFVKCNDYFSKVELTDIVYLKSEGNYLELYFEKQKRCIIRTPLKEFMKCLPCDKFIRVHNSFVINTGYIIKLTYNSIRVADYEVPVSRNRRNEIMGKIQVFS